ncbi:hypothetical protein [Antarcticirhabdus aurantiaca]|uniref:Uncharacterized protein n=1 Tax=Antarcticirhabdus aurantiaca TaxID=2606717 RepID=A0ACD4NT11_9HYPH|nr:hypothetical protein [Antarcticirhabdus aurantiaca]WAJ29991.1 hypothetical protein OXU80_07210 [Jeongeuplla avenae]
MSEFRQQSAAARLRAFRRIASHSISSDEGANAILAGSVLLLSCGFFAWVVSTAAKDPTFFERQLIAGMRSSNVDPITTGSTAAPADETGPAIPVPAVVRNGEVDPADYSIVALFESEAVVAAGDELWRVKVGSTLPGLGAVLAIETEAGGTGRVRTEKAVLSASR